MLPLYLRLLQHVSATQIMVHRMVWCCVFVLVWLFFRKTLHGVAVALRSPATRMRLFATAVLISINWLTYTWAVNNGHVVEASLGYFMNPLLNVALGVVILGERLTGIRWVAVGTALVGVLYLTLMQGRLPWIALVLAFSFSLYGLLRKIIDVEAVEGLAAETLLVAPLGLVYFAWVEYTGHGIVGSEPVSTWMLLMGGGLITAIPLALFAYGARRIPYSSLGVIQYMSPSLQMLLGIFVFGEAFSGDQAISFGLIWMALALYAAEGLRRRPVATGDA